MTATSREMRSVKNGELPQHAAKMRLWAHQWKGQTGYLDATDKQIGITMGVSQYVYARLISNYYSETRRPPMEVCRQIAQFYNGIGVTLQDVLEAFYYPTFARILQEVESSPELLPIGSASYILQALRIASSPAFSKNNSYWSNRALSYLTKSMQIGEIALSIADCVYSQSADPNANQASRDTKQVLAVLAKTA